MNLENKVLFIGAHPDDVIISASIKLNSLKNKAYVLTLTDGATRDLSKYPEHVQGLGTFYNWTDYGSQRINEDVSAFTKLGIIEKYLFADFINQETFKDLDKIINLIDGLVSGLNIKKIYTHDYPQSNPDHEVACFAAHVIGNKYDIEVWEYPMYVVKPDKSISFGENTGKYVDSEIIILNDDEINFKKELFKLYVSQPWIIDEHWSNKESFFLRKRNLMLDFDIEVPYIKQIIKASPKDVRYEIKKYLVKNI